MRHPRLSRSVKVDAYTIFEVLIAEHEADLRQYITQIVNDPELADEICRDAFVRAFYRVRQLRRKIEFKEWLKAIAFRLASNALLEYPNKRRKHALPPRQALSRAIHDQTLQEVVGPT